MARNSRPRRRDGRTILHFTGMTSTKYGSLERYFVLLSRECRARGLQTSIQYESEPSSQQYRAALADCETDAVSAVCNGAIGRSLTNAIRLVSSLAPAVVHCHFLEGLARVWVPVVSRALRVKRTLITVHCQPSYRRWHPAGAAYNVYGHVLAVSNSVRDALLLGGANPNRTSTFYLGTTGTEPRSGEQRALWRNRLQIPPDAVVLGCIGFDDPVKGLDILLGAIGAAKASLPEIRLLLVGVEPSRSSLPALAEALGISAQVHWAGILDEGWRALAAVDVYVQPSRSEGLCLAILEAMATGLPVVCTDVGGNAEAVQDGLTGLVVEPSISALASGVRTIVTQRALWAAMGSAAQHRYHQLFSADESVAKLVREFYAV